LEFYDQNWRHIVSRAAVTRNLETQTRIPPKCLGDQVALYAIPIATRISWARSRSTTRVEDTAYSLLGISDVNMPLLYGEGSRAFKRLQFAIMEKSTDESIFAAVDSVHLLARSPGDFDPRPLSNRAVSRTTYFRTFSAIQTGIRTRVSYYLDIESNIWAVFFNCYHEGSEEPIFRLFHPATLSELLPGLTYLVVADPGLRHEFDIQKRIQDLKSGKGRGSTEDQYDHTEAVLMY
jgi:hypothetical protein